MPASPTGRPRALFLGDSYTSGWGLADADLPLRWTTLVADARGWEEANAGFPGAGGSYKSRGLHFALTDPYPVLDSYGVSGNLFAAYWSGGSSSNMSGVSTFAWVPAANAAVGAGGLPAFTG